MGVKDYTNENADNFLNLFPKRSRVFDSVRNSNREAGLLHVCFTKRIITENRNFLLGISNCEFVNEIMTFKTMIIPDFGITKQLLYKKKNLVRR